MLQVAERAAAAATRSQSHPQAITMQRSSEVVQHGSFASIPPICRQREKKRKMPLALTPAFLRPQSRLVWLAVRAHQGTVSGTSRRLFRNRESEISSRLRWPGRLCHHLSRSPSLPLSLLNLLPPFRAPSLPPSLLPSANVPQGIRKYPRTHTHRPGNVFSSCEITLTTGHSEHTFVVVILPRRHPRHLPRTLQSPRDRDAMPAATSLVSHQCTVQPAYPLDARLLLPPIPIA